MLMSKQQKNVVECRQVCTLGAISESRKWNYPGLIELPHPKVSSSSNIVTSLIKRSGKFTCVHNLGNFLPSHSILILSTINFLVNIFRCLSSCFPCIFWVVNYYSAFFFLSRFYIPPFYSFSYLFHLFFPSFFPFFKTFLRYLSFLYFLKKRSG